jgi:hypothetical protein
VRLRCDIEISDSVSRQILCAVYYGVSRELLNYGSLPFGSGVTHRYIALHVFN